MAQLGADNYSPATGQLWYDLLGQVANGQPASNAFLLARISDLYTRLSGPALGTLPGPGSSGGGGGEPGGLPQLPPAPGAGQPGAPPTPDPLTVAGSFLAPAGSQMFAPPAAVTPPVTIEGFESAQGAGWRLAIVPHVTTTSSIIVYLAGFLEGPAEVGRVLPGSSALDGQTIVLPLRQGDVDSAGRPLDRVTLSVRVTVLTGLTDALVTSTLPPAGGAPYQVLAVLGWAPATA